jgi:hypothetical protein
MGVAALLRAAAPPGAAVALAAPLPSAGALTAAPLPAAEPALDAAALGL